VRLLFLAILRNRLRDQTMADDGLSLGFAITVPPPDIDLVRFRLVAVRVVVDTFF
jgi:hypothetical protein